MEPVHNPLCPVVNMGAIGYPTKCSCELYAQRAAIERLEGLLKMLQPEEWGALKLEAHNWGRGYRISSAGASGAVLAQGDDFYETLDRAIDYDVMDAARKSPSAPGEEND